MKSKLFILLLFLCSLQVFAEPAGQKGITLSKKGATVSEILDEIEAQSGYIFVTSGTDLGMTKDIIVRNAPLEDVLRNLFAGSNIEWTISGVNVYLATKGNASDRAQDQAKPSVTGKVVDSRSLCTR